MEKSLQQAKCEQQLEADDRRQQPLNSLLRHRESFSVFVRAPQVPMDNNQAESDLRQLSEPVS